MPDYPPMRFLITHLLLIDIMFLRNSAERGAGRRGKLVGLLLGFFLLEQLPLSARQVPITIMHTADLAGQLSPDSETMEGGLLRVAELIAQTRESVRYSLLFDSGNIFYGSPESEVLDGATMHGAAKWLKYDAMIPGEEDLGWGTELLEDLPLIAANLQGLDGAERYGMISVGGVQIAIVGITHPALHRQFSSAALPEGLRVSDPLAVLREVLPEVRELKPDITILVAHLGVGDDEFSVRSVMFEFPDVDLIIGGHTGKKVVAMEAGGGLYTQAPKHGRGLGRVDLVWDTVQQKLIHREASILRASKGYRLHGALVQELRPLLDDANTQLSEALCGLKEPLVVKSVQGEGTKLLDWLGVAISSKLEADVVFVHPSIPGKVEGETLERKHLWQFFPQDQCFATATLTGEDLKALISEWHLQESASMVCAFGLRYQQADGEVRRLQDSSGKPINPRKRLKVAFPSSWLIAGGESTSVRDEILARPISRMAFDGCSLRKTLADFLRSGGAQ